jgi:hypothetical protein
LRALEMNNSQHRRGLFHLPVESSRSQTMTDLLTLVSELRRPRILIRAARAGVTGYDRNRDLKRVMRVAEPPSPERALSALIAAEAAVEETRKAGAATYSFTRHIELLIAMIGEGPRVGGRGGGG